MSSKRVELDKLSFAHQPFTTEPKLRRVSWHRQDTVKTRASMLMESFFPDNDLPYEAVKVRMANLLGVVDRTTVLAYLGRPAFQQRQNLDQEVMYRRSGTIVNKTHTFIHRLPAKKGYIELFDLGYCYQVKDKWFIHWNYTVQETLPTQPHYESHSQKVTIDNISLTKIQQQTQEHEDAKEDKDTLEREKLYYVSKREREIVKVKVISIT